MLMQEWRWKNEKLSLHNQPRLKQKLMIWLFKKAHLILKFLVPRQIFLITSNSRIFEWYYKKRGVRDWGRNSEKTIQPLFLLEGLDLHDCILCTNESNFPIVIAIFEYYGEVLRKVQTHAINAGFLMQNVFLHLFLKNTIETKRKLASTSIF